MSQWRRPTRYRAVVLTPIRAATICFEGVLGLAGTRGLRKQILDGLSGFGPALLLKLVNPIGDCLNHFARRLGFGIALDCGRRLSGSLVLFYDFDGFLL